MKFAGTLLALLLLVSGVCVAGGTSRLIRVHTKDPEAIHRIAVTGVDIVAGGPGWLDVVEHPGDRNLAKALVGLRTTVRLENVHAPYEAFRGREDLGVYHTMQEIADECDAIAQEHSEIVHLEIIGQTYQGREIRALCISDNPGVDEGEPAVLILGSVHSREWIANEVVMATINHLVDNYGRDAEVTRLVDAREIWLVPVANVDGAHYSQTEKKMWRKTRRDNGDGTFGVDANRNWGYAWGGPGSSADTSSDTYHGPEPFSEPCIAALRDLCLRERFSASIACHSYSELVLWPFGTTYDTPDDVETFSFHGRKLAQFMGGYEPKQASGLYPCSGISDDWLYGEMGMLSFTFEFGTQFIPAESEVPSINERFVKAALYLAEVGDKPFPLLMHTPPDPTTDLAGPYSVTVKFNQKSHPDFSVAAIELVFATDTGDVVIPTSSLDGEYYTGTVEASGYGRKSYRVRLRGADGSTHVFPSNGQSYHFDVVPTLYLIVDDDKGKSYETYYKEAFAALDLPVVSWETTEKGTPSLSTLLAAEAVVWQTGNDTSTTLTDEEQAVLGQYLSQGGVLLLFGQDIGYDIKNQPFYGEVLHAKYYLDSSGHEELTGADFLAGEQLSIAGGGDNVTQFYPEAFYPITGAKELLRWTGDDKNTCGALSFESDSCRLAYFGFGLEGFRGAEARARVLKKGLDWLAEPSRALARRATALGRIVRDGTDTQERIAARTALDAFWSDLPRRAVADGLSRGLLDGMKDIDSLVRVRFERAARRAER